MKKLCSLLVAFFMFFSDATPLIAADLSLPPAEDIAPIREPNTEIPPADGTESNISIALPGEIGINEILSNPTEGEEWVEIVSLADDERSLAGFTLSDAVGIIFTFPESTVISPGGFLVVSGWGSKLNNTGDTVSLSDSTGASIAEGVVFPALEKGQSWAFDGNAYRVATEPTPEEANIFSDLPEDPPAENVPSESVFPLPNSDEIIISEILSNPETGQEEWVELFLSVVEERSLSGVTLSDEVGVIHTFSETDAIGPGEFLVVSGWGSKLNNTGDSVFLRSPSGETLAESNGFPTLEKGESWLPEENSKGIPTPGEENIVLEEEPKDTPEEIELPPDLADLLPPSSGEVVVSEILSNPAGGDEWAELFSSAAERRHLGGFTFSDDVGVFFTLPVGTVLNPDEYLVISGWKSKLNNTGDSLLIKDASGSEYSQRVTFPSLNKNVSWAFDGEKFQKTGSPTPNSQNIITEPSSSPSASSGSSSSNKSPLVRTKASMPSAGIDEFEIIISEVLFRGKDEDFVELFCQKCDIDLGGIRVADDDRFFEFPPETFVKTGEYIVIHLSKEPKEDYSEDGVWHFWSEKTGLTGTDETVFLLDSRGNVEDAVCIADRSGNFSPGEEQDIIQLIHTKALQSPHPLSEEACFDSRKLATNVSLVFTGKKTGSSSHDYFWSEEMTPGEKNPPAPQKIKSGELSIADFVSLPENHVGMRIKNISQKRIQLGDFFLAYGEESLPLPEKMLLSGEEFTAVISDYSGGEIKIIDHWGDAIFTAENPKTVELSSGTGNILLSEIFPNPEGEDSGAEFVELLCMAEICRADQTALFINDTFVGLPSETLQKDEYLLFNAVSLRNSDLTIGLYDFSAQVFETLSIDSAKEGKSYSRFGNEFLWAIPTPEKGNIPDNMTSSADADSDGIPDADELLLGLNPFLPNKKNSPDFKLFTSYIKRGSSLSISEQKEGLNISGKTLPNAEVVIVFHSKRETMSTISNENGEFEIIAFPNIEPGYHKADMIIVAGPKNTFVVSDKAEVTLTKNPQQNWLKNVEISMVLPNPTGKDSIGEIIILKNNEDHGGFLKGAEFSSGKVKKKIPDIYFTARQTKIFSKKDIPTLKNSSGDISLLDRNGKEMGSISWEKAKEGQWFGPDAPAYISKTSNKKKSKLSSRKAKTSDDPQAEEAIKIQQEGIFIFLEDGRLGILSPDDQLILYRIDSEKLSEKTLNGYLKKGQEIILVLQDGIITEIQVPPALPTVSIPEPIPERDIFFISLLLLAILLAAIAPVLIKIVFQKKQRVS